MKVRLMSKANKMAKEFKFGQMALSMKVIGRKVNGVARVGSLTQKVTCMKVTLKRVKLMDLVYIHMLMVPITVVNGSMINKKEVAKNVGQMGQNLKECTKMVSKMAMER